MRTSRGSGSRSPLVWPAIEAASARKRNRVLFLISRLEPSALPVIALRTSVQGYSGSFGAAGLLRFEVRPGFMRLNHRSAIFTKRLGDQIGQIVRHIFVGDQYGAAIERFCWSPLAFKPHRHRRGPHSLFRKRCQQIVGKVEESYVCGCGCFGYGWMSADCGFEIEIRAAISQQIRNLVRAHLNDASAPAADPLTARSIKLQYHVDYDRNRTARRLHHDSRRVVGAQRLFERVIARAGNILFAQHRGNPDGVEAANQRADVRMRPAPVCSGMAGSRPDRGRDLRQAYLDDSALHKRSVADAAASRHDFNRNIRREFVFEKMPQRRGEYVPGGAWRHRADGKNLSRLAPPGGSQPYDHRH